MVASDVRGMDVAACAAKIALARAMQIFFISAAPYRGRVFGAQPCAAQNARIILAAAGKDGPVPTVCAWEITISKMSQRMKQGRPESPGRILYQFRAS
jgi:hypothetical protein